MTLLKSIIDQSQLVKDNPSIILPEEIIEKIQDILPISSFNKKE